MVDLHVHSTCSDGTFTPEELVDYAIQKGNFICDEKNDAIDTGKRDSKNILEQLKNDEDYVQGILRYFCK